MAERLVIHVGPPKSGSTYLQSVLWDHRDALRRAGILLPGRVPFDHNLVATYVRSEQPGGRAANVWRRVVAAVDRWPGTAVLSNEWFALASARDAAAALTQFGSAEVHLVATARDLLAVAPAAWQERVKLGYDTPLDEFVESLDGSEDRWSWWTLDAARVLERWAPGLPRDRVHVVTVPGRSGPPDLLWRRFAEAAGIPADACDPATASANESLGAESARLMQLLGARLREAVDADTAPWTEQYRWLRRYVGHELLVPRRGRKIALRPDQAAAVRERGRVSAAALRAAGYHVVGDLEELTSGTVPADAVHPDDVPAEALLEAAMDLVPALLRRVRDEVDRHA